MKKYFAENALKLSNAFLYSIDGLKFLLNERAFRQEIKVSVILVFIELFRQSSFVFKLYLFSSYMLILLAEGVNTSIEICIDRIGLEENELSKKAKDVASSTVFLAISHFLVIWIASWFI